MSRDTMQTDGSRPRVVIVGAGFAGLWAARSLAKAPVEVVLIDRHNYHTFVPLLYQVAAAELAPDEILEPVRRILRGQDNVRFLLGEVRKVDTVARQVRTAEETLRYDYLVVAAGSTTHTFGVPGADRHALPLKTTEDAIALRNHILHCFERADRTEDPAEQRALLTFVVVGGGPTGAEFAGALSELINGPLKRDHPRLSEGGARVVLVEAADRLLSTYPERLTDYALDRLQRMGVEVRLGTAVQEVQPRAVILADGERIDSATAVWTAGVQGTPRAGEWGLPVGRGGRVPVRETLQLLEDERIYVAGDLAWLELGGEPLPMTAAVATRQGEQVGRNIARQVAGQAPQDFAFRDPGMMVTLGRNHGLGQLGRASFTGFLAWLVWLAVHLVKLIGFHNRAAVLLNWAWDYFFYERVSRLIIGGAPAHRLLHPGTLALHSNRFGEEETMATARSDS